jgi:DNA modification methylase
METLHKINDFIEIYIDDVLTAMKNLKDNSIDLIITSPPYFNQRDYKTNNQWGNETELEEYLSKIELWCKECFRVLKNSGTLFLNIGDKYNKKGLLLIPERIAIIFSNNNWCLRNNIVWYKPNHMPSPVQDRFCNTYENVYFFIKESNKYYSNEYYSNIDILRIKNNNQSNNKWPLTLEIYDYETKWKPLIDEHNESKRKLYKGKFKDEDINIGSSPGARNAKGISYSLQRKNKLSKIKGLEINKFILEHYRKNNISLENIDKAFKYKGTASHWIRTDNGRSLPKSEDWYKLKELLNIQETKYDSIMCKMHYVLQNVKSNPKGKNPGDMWCINNQKTMDKHFATFPIELPSRIIKGFCPPDGIVLDPFCGSGTTGLACKIEKRKCILIDCNEDFLEIIKKKCNS